MKRLKLILITLFVFLFGIVNVNAMTLKPTGDTSGKRGSEINLYITLNRSTSEKTISAVDGKFSYDANVLTMVKAESLMGSNWSEFSPVTNNGTFSYANISFNNLITDTSKNIVKVVFKVNDNASYGNTIVSVSGASATDQEGNGVTVSGGSHTVKVLSDVNTLTNLTVTGGTLNFNENTTTYNLEINSDKVTINATKKDSNSTLSGAIGEYNLKYGLNAFSISVTSESGLKKTYTLNITRPDNRSKINTLSKLEISEGNIKFNKDTLTYNVNVENNITKVEVNAELTDSKSTFVSGYGSRTVNLTEGKNVIEVKVKAENESIRTYTINVTRKSNKSSNNYLSELKLDHGDINFNKDTLEYRISINNDVENIEVEAKTEDSKAKYEISGNKNLKVGENEIIIKVFAEDNSDRVYKIIVTRKEKDEVLSSNSKLASLTIDGYNIDFNSEVYKYELTIEEENSLIINYTKEDESSNVTINGNNDLKDGSVIEVLVLAEDGSKTIYSININKNESNNNNLFMIILIGVILLVIVAVIFIILKKKKDNNDDNNMNNNIDNNVSNSIDNNMFSNDMVNNNMNFSFNSDLSNLQLNNPVNEQVNNELNNQINNNVQSMDSAMSYNTVSQNQIENNNMNQLNNIQNVNNNTYPNVVNNQPLNSVMNFNTVSQNTVENNNMNQLNNNGDM